MAAHQPITTTIKRTPGKGRLSILALLFIFLLALLAGGCGAAPKAARDSAAPMEPAATESEIQAGTAGYASLTASGGNINIEAAVTGRKVIRNADITISVKDIHEVTSTISQMVEAAGGMVSDSSISQTKDRLHATMQLRLPANRFEQFILELDGLGEITHQRTYSEDVTEEFIDLEAKIKNLESQEETLRKLIAESDNVADLLAVEKELARVRSEIDSLKGRLRYLSDRVELSTINLTLKELSALDQRISASNLSGLGKRSLQAFIRATNLVLELLGGLVVLLVGAIPVLIFLGLIALLGRYPLRWLRQFANKRKADRQE